MVSGQRLGIAAVVVGLGAQATQVSFPGSPWAGFLLFVITAVLLMLWAWWECWRLQKQVHNRRVSLALSVALCALAGGFSGWMLWHAYPRSVAQESETTKMAEQPLKDKQSSTGHNSPNIVGDGNSVVINPSTEMPPLAEGLAFVSRQIPSPRPDAPYAIEITVQSRVNIQPFAIGFITDNPIVGGDFSLAVTVMMGVKQGFLNSDPGRSYWVSIESPALTPQKPLLVTLFGKQPFKVVKTVRIQDQ